MLSNSEVQRHWGLIPEGAAASAHTWGWDASPEWQRQPCPAAAAPQREPEGQRHGACCGKVCNLALGETWQHTEVPDNTTGGSIWKINSSTWSGLLRALPPLDCAHLPTVPKLCQGAPWLTQLHFYPVPRCGMARSSPAEPEQCPAVEQPLELHRGHPQDMGCSVCAPRCCSASDTFCPSCFSPIPSEERQQAGAGFAHKHPTFKWFVCHKQHVDVATNLWAGWPRASWARR